MTIRTKYLGALFAATLAYQAHALPVSFDATDYQTSAAAGVASVNDDDARTGPPDALPLASDAAVITGTDFASASATADAGFLGAVADVFGLDEDVYAFAAADFLGDFLAPGGPLFLRIDFVDDLLADGGESDAELAVVLLAGGAVLLDQVIAGSQLFTYAFDLPAGSFASLQLSLVASAEASATAPGAATRFTGADFAVSVPEAPVLWIFLTGLCLVLWFARRSPPVTGATPA